MALKSPFRRKDKADAPSVGPESTPSDDLRTRARRRLIGAVLLLGVGIVAFPILFETTPRPIPVDLPIEVPRKDTVAPLALPAASSVVHEQPVEPSPPKAAEAVERIEPAASKPSTPAPASEARPARTAEPEVKPEPKGDVNADAPSKKVDDGKRAKALLDGKAPAVSTERWVVQIGAFAEDRTVRDARAKASKLGLETFTQTVHVQAGERTRVRVGPFDRRDAADAAAAKLTKGGLPATVLKL